MKILLVYPPFLVDRAHAENIEAMPIGMYYLGAALRKKGYDAHLANWHNAAKEPEGVEQALLDLKPDVVAISIFHANRLGGVGIARVVRHLLPETKVLFGGIGATFLAKDLLEQQSEIDYVLRGEGDLALPQFLETLKNGGDPRSVPGLCFRDGDEIVVQDCAPLVDDLDSLPDPAEYYTFNHLALSRGCPGKCSFCGSPAFWGAKVRFHSAEYFVNQIKRQYERGVKFFFISDDTFTLKKELVLDICRRIVESGMQINWAAISRVDCVDQQVLHAMRLAGCIQLSFGVETGDEGIRRTLKKKFSNEEVVKAFQLVRSFGILPRAYIIYGNPGETDETIQATIDLIKEIKPLIALFHVLSLFPGTELYDDAEAAGKITQEIKERPSEEILWCEVDDALNMEQVYEWGNKIKAEYFNNLPEFVKDIKLLDLEELLPLHADFLSRLALTFHQGDYAYNEDIPDKEQTAYDLYIRSLKYSANPRAYLGLGTLLQQVGESESSEEAFSEGVKRYPDDEQLVLRFGMVKAHQGKIEEALELFQRLPESRDAAHLSAQCYQALGDKEKEAQCLKRVEELSG